VQVRRQGAGQTRDSEAPARDQAPRRVAVGG
jgi:biopolymer transport protein ExbB